MMLFEYFAADAADADAATFALFIAATSLLISMLDDCFLSIMPPLYFQLCFAISMHAAMPPLPMLIYAGFLIFSFTLFRFQQCCDIYFRHAAAIRRYFLLIRFLLFFAD